MEKVTNLTKGKVTVNCLGFLGDPNPVSNRSVSQIFLPSFFFFLTFFLLCYRRRLFKKKLWNRFTRRCSGEVEGRSGLWGKPVVFRVLGKVFASTENFL